jgi:hypothetical protein
VREILKNPKITVVPIDKRGGHYYQGFKAKTKKLIGEFKSVTGELDIIGGGQTHGLMWWAKRLALSELLRLLARAEREQGYTLHEFTDEMAEAATKKQNIALQWVQVLFDKAIRKDREALKEAATIGTRVHLLIDAYITNTMPEKIDDDIVPAWNNFTRFLFEHDIQFVCGDLPVFSAKHKFGGRLDALALIDGQLVLLDWKTANDIRDDVAPQIGGYNKALLETYGLRAERGITVRFHKTNASEFETRECNMENAEKAFLCAHNLNSIFKKELLWINYEEPKKKESAAAA